MGNLFVFGGSVPDNITSDTPRLPPVDGWPLFMTIGQAAYVLDISPQRVQALIRAKALKGERLGRERLVISEGVRRLAHVRHLRSAA